MANLRQIRRRIKSVENTKKITRAMEMVAAAKLKRLQDMLAQSDHYGQEFRRILASLLQGRKLTNPLLQKREAVKKILAIVITSDTGLCGAYNTNLVSKTREMLSNKPADVTAEFVAFGKHGATYLKRENQTIIEQIAIPKPAEIDQSIEHVTKMATERFIQRKADQVFFIYTKVVSLSTLVPTVTMLLPIAAEDVSATSSQEPADYIVEPDLEEVFAVLVPEVIEAEISKYVKHALVAEQASRMMAMRQATDNAKEMIDSLTLQRNKVRQAAITKELIEVVSGSRAQKK